MNKNNFNLYSLEIAKQIDENQKIVLQLDEKSLFLYEKPFSHNYDDSRQLHTSYIIDYTKNPEFLLKNKIVIKSLFDRFEKIQITLLELFKNNYKIYEMEKNQTIIYNSYITLIESQLNDQLLRNATKNPTIFLPFLNPSIEELIIKHQKSLLYNMVIFNFIDNSLIETDYKVYKRYSIEKNKDYNNNFLCFVKSLKGENKDDE
jgi:hypothetical protein